MRLALVLAALLAVATPAAAQTIDLGSGTQPALALDAAGTAYIAWIGVEPNTTSLHLCRLPRGATACELNQAIAVPGTSLSRPFVMVDGSTVRIVTYRYGLTGQRFDEIYRLTSADRGATFDAGAPIGTNPFYDAVPGPGTNTVSTIANNSANFQRVSLDATSSDVPVATLTPDHPYNPSIALIDPSSLLAVFANGSGAAQFRTFTSNGSNDPNSEPSWAPVQDFSPYAAYLRLAAGPNGVFLLSDNANGNQEVRRWGVGSFGAPVVIPGPTHEFSGDTHDLYQDAAGRLHLVWGMGDADGAHLGYAVSDDGAAWRVGRMDVADPRDVSKGVGGIRVAALADHVGVATWDNGGGSGSIVHARAIGPEPPVPTPTPTPTPTPAPTATPAPFRPTPSLGKSVTAEAVKGTVLVKAPGASGYTKLTGLGSVPVGSSVDTRKGTVRLNAASDNRGGVQTGNFFDGLFVVRQKAAAKPLTDLVLTGGKFTGCPSARRATAAAKKKVRRLWGNGKGRFRTRGKYASATVRGTFWEVADRCDGTLVTVKSGSVSVRDKRRRKTVVVKARKSYLARARSR